MRTFRQQLREALLVQIRGSVAATARQLVEANTEHRLETVDALRSRDALDEEVNELLIRGVSTRNYEGAPTNLSEGLGLKRSAVSSASRRASQKDLDALNGRSLEDWAFVAIFIDGITFKDHTCVAVLGIERDGTMRILGVREGATENAALVYDLLANLEGRGLSLPSRALVIIDGSKALSSAVRKTFGRQAVVQRCVHHKLPQRGVLPSQEVAWGSETPAPRCLGHDRLQGRQGGTAEGRGLAAGNTL